MVIRPTPYDQEVLGPDFFIAVISTCFAATGEIAGSHHQFRASSIQTKEMFPSNSSHKKTLAINTL